MLPRQGPPDGDGGGPTARSWNPAGGYARGTGQSSRFSARGVIVRLWRDHARTWDASNRCQPSHPVGHRWRGVGCDRRGSRTWQLVSSAQVRRSLGAEPLRSARACRPASRPDAVHQNRNRGPWWIMPGGAVDHEWSTARADDLGRRL